MGIHGLTTYVDTLPFGEGKVWQSYDLCDTNLIIDGCGLYYHVYGSNNLNIKFGGQYDQLQNKLKEFFKKLRANNVVPYVVLDGIMDKDEKKLGTYIKRKTELITRMRALWTSRNPGYDMVIPRLAQLAVVQVLQEIEVPYAVADFEADCEIASLANELDAPVMGNDSDFYIFNIKHGYIPFQHYSFSGSNITVKRFSFNGFAKHLGINPDMSPLLASLTGNDYISGIMLTPFTAHIRNLVSSSHLNACGKSCKVPTIAQFLSKYKSMPEAFDAVIGLFPNSGKFAFEKALRLSIKEYQQKESNLIGYFHSCDLSSIVETYNGHTIPQWLIKLYREGLLAEEALACLCNRKVFLKTQSEDTSLPSAQMCVQDLRWYYYSLAMNCEHCGTGVVGVSGTQSQDQRASIHEVETSQTDSSKILAEDVASKPQTTANSYKPSGNTRLAAAHSGHMFDQESQAQGGHYQAQSSEHSKLVTDFEHIHLIKENEDSQNQSIRNNDGQPPAAEANPAILLTADPNETILTRHTDVPQTTDSTKVITVTEYEREGSTLAQKKINLPAEVPEIKIHDILQMSIDAKRSHLLSLLHSNLPFIHHLPIKHQLVVSALRYWVIHSQVKQEHLAALLVRYVGEEWSPASKPESIQVSIEAVHGFSQWQNVLYWAERLNSLFSSTFPQLQVSKLYNGVHVCQVYERLKVAGIKLAESIVIDINSYRKLYDTVTKDLPCDCQFNQSQRSQKKSKENRKSGEINQTKSKSAGCLKGNMFALLCEESEPSDSDDD